MAAARELIEAGDYDAALMDVHIRGERVFPLCEMLEARQIPFVFTSGYADWHMLEKWQDRPRLQKPYTPRAGRRSAQFGPERLISLRRAAAR